MDVPVTCGDHFQSFDLALTPNSLTDLRRVEDDCSTLWDTYKKVMSVDPRTVLSHRSAPNKTGPK